MSTRPRVLSHPPAISVRLGALSLRIQMSEAKILNEYVTQSSWSTVGSEDDSENSLRSGTSLYATWSVIAIGQNGFKKHVIFVLGVGPRLEAPQP